MRRLPAFCLIVMPLLTPSASVAAQWQPLPSIQLTVESFVKEKTAMQPGEYTVTVSRLDPRLKLAECSQLEPYLPTGNRLWGNSSIGVRCNAPSRWSIYVPVHIKVSNQVLVTTRPIASGNSVAPEDVQLQMRDITAFAGSALTSLDQIVGKNVSGPVASGTVLRAEMLRAAQVIRQGQQVKLVAQGSGFKVTSEGQAMGNATPGQVVSVKTRSGQLIKGIAKSEGIVEVYF